MCLLGAERPVLPSKGPRNPSRGGERVERPYAPEQSLRRRKLHLSLSLSLSFFFSPKSIRSARGRTSVTQAA